MAKWVTLAVVVLLAALGSKVDHVLSKRHPAILLSGHAKSLISQLLLCVCCARLAVHSRAFCSLC